MSKKLIAKTQELNPKLPQFSNSFSKCFSIIPDDRESILKKGTIYAIFEIFGSSNFDTELIIKVINDVLHDSYYQSDNISPIQSMEKTITEVKQKIAQLSNDTLIADSQGTAFNFISAILWGNVVYVIRFGEMDSSLMKGGELSPMEMISEGNFSSFSKIINEDEVFIFCTKSFSDAFPTERLLSSSISENDMGPDQSCLLVKVTLDTSAQEEEIDLGLGSAVTKSRNREKFEKVTGVLKKFLAGTGIVLNNFLKIVRPLLEDIKTIMGKIIPKRKMVLFTRKIAQTAGQGNKKSKGWLFLSIGAVILATSVFFAFKSKIFKEKEEVPPTETNEIKIEEVTVEKEDRSKDEEYKIKRVSPEIFYDLKIADTESNPTEIQVVENKLIVVDREKGKIYHSDIAAPNFVTEDNSYVGIKSLAQSNSLLTFNDEEGYKTYDIEKSELVDSYAVESLNITYPYSGYIYSISNDILTRSSIKDGKLEGTLWGQNPDFKDAVSMAIAYSVYILKNDGELVEYSGGAKTDFSVSGLEKSFQNPVKIVADLDFENIYIADKGNKSIVSLNEDGELITQYKNDDDSLWGDIRSISVTQDEKTIFVLDSNKIFKLNVEE